VKYATDVTAQARARIEIMQIVASLGGAAKELTGISESMSTAATQTVAQSGIVLGSARVVSQNIQDVAAGTEEMSASIREISVSAQSSARVAKAAVTTANETNVTITKLGESSAEIGKVIKVITTIAP
jgi:methyl-accepting chemotaxis protein